MILLSVTSMPSGCRPGARPAEVFPSASPYRSSQQPASGQAANCRAVGRSETDSHPAIRCLPRVLPGISPLSSRFSLALLDRNAYRLPTDAAVPGSRSIESRREPTSGTARYRAGMLLPSITLIPALSITVPTLTRRPQHLIIPLESQVADCRRRKSASTSPQANLLYRCLRLYSASPLLEV